jgi:hypothetical protein
VRFAASPLVNCRGHKTRADHSASATGADLIVLAIQISALFSFGRRSRDQKNSTNPENPLSAWFTVMDRRAHDPPSLDRSEQPLWVRSGPIAHHSTNDGCRRYFAVGARVGEGPKTTQPGQFSSLPRMTV